MRVIQILIASTLFTSLGVSASAQKYINSPNSGLAVPAPQNFPQAPNRVASPSPVYQAPAPIINAPAPRTMQPMVSGGIVQRPGNVVVPTISRAPAFSPGFGGTAGSTPQTMPSATVQRPSFAPSYSGQSPQSAPAGGRVVAPAINQVPTFSPNFGVAGSTQSVMPATTPPASVRPSFAIAPAAQPPQNNPPNRPSLSSVPALQSNSGIGNTTPPAAIPPSNRPNFGPAASGYTFTPTSSGTLQVSQGGKIVATTSPEYATQQYGYRPSSPTPVTTQTPTSQTRPNLVGPSVQSIESAPSRQKNLQATSVFPSPAPNAAAVQTLPKSTAAQNRSQSSIHIPGTPVLRADVPQKDQRYLLSSSDYKNKTGADPQCLSYVRSAYYPELGRYNLGSAAELYQKRNDLPGFTFVNKFSIEMQQKTVKPGDMLVFDPSVAGGFGHVAAVKSYNPQTGDITVDQRNYGKPYKDTHIFNLYAKSGLDTQIVGVISPATPLQIPIGNTAGTTPALRN